MFSITSSAGISDIGYSIAGWYVGAPVNIGSVRINAQTGDVGTGCFFGMQDEDDLVGAIIQPFDVRVDGLLEMPGSPEQYLPHVKCTLWGVNSGIGDGLLISLSHGCLHMAVESLVTFRSHPGEVRTSPWHSAS